MKRILSYLTVAALAGLFFVSCAPTVADFDRTFLYSGTGEWVSTQDFGDGPEEIHDRFLSGGTGSTWSETLGTPEQAFKWSLDGEVLTFIHKIELAGTYGVPKEYTVVTLTETTLVYKDSWGNRISCTKVKNSTQI